MAENVNPFIIHTKGKWQEFEDFANKELENGKTYNIKVKGNCEFMISETKPTSGIATNEITYTKQPNLKLWVKTGVK